MTDHQTLLADYNRNGSDAAFRELVTRYVDLVFSTALRLVEGDTHRAQDVVQTVFVDLARVARTLPADVKLGGWLHRDTCFVATTLMRGERRRQARERQAVEMNTLQNHSEADFSQIAPLLDEAINELDEADRTAILLRFFERQDFRAVGQALGSNEDAARMRVNRALDKLEGLLKRRGVTTSAASLGVVLTANAVQAAPVGLALTISTAAAVAGTTSATTATATATKAIAMTTLQKTLIATTIVAAVGTGIYEARQVSQLRDQIQTLQRQQAEQVQQLVRERDEAASRLAGLRDDNERLNRNTAELLKLRGEVGMLRGQATRARSAEQENDQLRPALAKAQSSADQLAFKQLEENTVNDMKQLGLGIRLYAGDHNDVLATNFDQFISNLPMKTNANGTVAFRSGNELANFEFMNVGLVNERMPDTLIFREKVPRRTPDGKWTRAYGFADGRVVTQVSDDGNFGDWENQHTVPPQARP